MNEELRRLLGASGLENDWAWDRMVITINRGPLAGPDVDATSRPGAFGFDGLLLGPDYRPRYYCKVRPVDDEKLRRETSILRSFARDSEAATAVPRAHGSASERIRIQLTDYLEGPSGDRLFSRTGPLQWSRWLEELLELGDLLSERGMVLLPQLNRGAEAVRLLDEAEPALRHLAASGLLGEAEAPLKELLRRAGSLLPKLQHGDFWPGNVVRTSHGWRAIDFEDFGSVQVPLYDVFHMLRTSDLLRRNAPSEASWVRGLLREDLGARESRRLLLARARRVGLGPAAVSGVLVYYLLELTRRFHERGAPASYWQPLVRDLHEVVGVVRSDRRIESLLLAA